MADITYKARWGSAGEILITDPDGRVQFLSLLGFIRFCWSCCRTGDKIEVPDA